MAGSLRRSRPTDRQPDHRGVQPARADSGQGALLRYYAAIKGSDDICLIPVGESGGAENGMRCARVNGSENYRLRTGNYGDHGSPRSGPIRSA